MSFENAAVTKGTMIFLALVTILAGIFDIKHYFHLQFVPHISRQHQYWRLVTHQLAFSNSADFFLAELLLYNVGRRIERQFGGVKYASFIFVSLLLATFLQFISVILFYRVGVNHIALGPMAVLFSILYQYSRIVPSVYIYRIFGIAFNNKSTNYILALQLAISRPLSSIAAALIGILTGKLYRSDLAGFNAYRLPSSFIRFSRTVFLPFIGSIHPLRRTNRAAPDNFGTPQGGSAQNDEIITTAPTTGTTRGHISDDGGADLQPAPNGMQEWVDELRGRVDQANAGLRVPSQVEITHMTSMFPSIEREVVVGALQRSPNIEVAVETLLTSQSE